MGRFERANKRSLRRMGTTGDIINQEYERDSLDEYRNPELKEPEVIEDVPMEIIMSGTPNFERRADGLDDDINIIGFVSDDENVTTGSEDKYVRATRIQYNNLTITVRNLFDENNGLLRFHGSVE